MTSKRDSSSPFTDLLEVNGNDSPNCVKASKYAYNSMSDISVNSDSSSSGSNLKVTKKSKKNSRKVTKGYKTKNVEKSKALNESNSCHTDPGLCCLIHQKYFLLDKKSLDLKELEGKKTMPKISIVEKKCYSCMRPDLYNCSTSTPIIVSNDSNQVSDTNDSATSAQENLLKSFESQQYEQINKLCSNLGHLNVTNKDTLKNCLRHADYIDNQIIFFKRISEIIESFVSLNSFLTFKLNNNPKFDGNSGDADIKFSKLEEFLKLSTQLRKWLKKFESTETQIYDTYAGPTSLSQAKDHASTKSQNLIIDKSDYFKLETELYNYKKQMDSSVSLNSLLQEKQQLLDESDNSFLTVSESHSSTHNSNSIQSNADFNFERESKFDEIQKKCQKYEEKIQMYKIEIIDLKKKLNLLNSKEYKVLKLSTYEALKLQLKLYQHDYKMELQEKKHFQRECLVYEEKLNSLLANGESWANVSF